MRRVAPELCDTLSGRGPGDESMPNLTRFRAGGSGVADGGSGALAASKGAFMRVAMLLWETIVLDLAGRGLAETELSSQVF